LPKSEAGLLESENNLNLFRCGQRPAPAPLNNGYLFAAFQLSPASARINVKKVSLDGV
jgi:hypothetical protein